MCEDNEWDEQKRKRKKLVSQTAAAAWRVIYVSLLCYGFACYFPKGLLHLCQVCWYCALWGGARYFSLFSSPDFAFFFLLVLSLLYNAYVVPVVSSTMTRTLHCCVCLLSSNLNRPFYPASSVHLSVLVPHHIILYTL